MVIGDFMLHERRFWTTDRCVVSKLFSRTLVLTPAEKDLEGAYFWEGLPTQPDWDPPSP